jgi:hypothetical protein
MSSPSPYRSRKRKKREREKGEGRKREGRNGEGREKGEEIRFTDPTFSSNGFCMHYELAPMMQQEIQV